MARPALDTGERGGSGPGSSPRKAQLTKRLLGPETSAQADSQGPAPTAAPRARGKSQAEALCREGRSTRLSGTLLRERVPGWKAKGRDFSSGGGRSGSAGSCPARPPCPVALPRQEQQLPPGKPWLPCTEQGAAWPGWGPGRAGPLAHSPLAALALGSTQRAGGPGRLQGVSAPQAAVPVATCLGAQNTLPSTAPAPQGEGAQPTPEKSQAQPTPFSPRCRWGTHRPSRPHRPEGKGAPMSRYRICSPAPPCRRPPASRVGGLRQRPL